MKHGSESTYSNHGCRCGPCKEANADAQRGRRVARAALLRVNPGRAKHGSESTYSNWLCRCRPCRDAHAAHNARLRTKRGGS